ncbi:TMM40 protein, partial [Upupa epops]|nr:TMM40 protein [Upupa epops]
ATTLCSPLPLLHSDLLLFLTDVFQRDFSVDAIYLENHEEMNQPFWESLVKCLSTTDPPILNSEEKNTLLNSCSVLPGGCAACLKAIEKKGVKAIIVLYLLLRATNPSGYGQLPSSKGKDEKLKLLERLEVNLTPSQWEEKTENSSHESTDEDTQGKEELGFFSLTYDLLLSVCNIPGAPAEVVPYTDSEFMAVRDLSFFAAYEKQNANPHQWTVGWMGIRKDDEFFHFVILCFATGVLLVCYYYYKDWTVSLGIGLITFASLETTGIYFGLVYRIRSVLDGFIPLIHKFRPTGNGDLMKSTA